MSGNLNRRLNKLQVIAGGRGCPTCRRWDHTVVIIETPAGEDVPANVTPWADEPIAVDHRGRCLSCGRRQPALTTTIIIEAPEDAG